jgi:hypothetical protein
VTPTENTPEVGLPFTVPANWPAKYALSQTDWGHSSKPDIVPTIAGCEAAPTTTGTINNAIAANKPIRRVVGTS